MVMQALEFKQAQSIILLFFYARSLLQYHSSIISNYFSNFFIYQFFQFFYFILIYQYIFIYLDMIDKVLGFEQPAPRRRRPDNASQSSSKVQVAAVTTASPAKPVIRKLNTQEASLNQPKTDDGEEGPMIVQSVHRSKSKPTVTKVQAAKQQSKQENDVEQTPRSQSKPTKRTESEEDIHSPQVRNLKIAQMPRSSKVDEMRNSGKFQLRQSACGLEIHAVNNDYETSYKLKMLAVLIVGLLMTLYAMTPARKAPGRRN